MKKEVAEKWVAALRSGKYTQGRFQLRTIEDKYCCLGVLCDVLSIPATLRGTQYGYGRTGSCGVLPYEALTLSGMRNAAGSIPRTGEHLLALNDSGATFSEIADIIEKNWEKL